ncbi:MULTISPECIES: ABC transporter substrate-binding protein [Rhizobium/Agrobacterium group]|uniref:ABC transporter substrate-binding protein n=1 Tax=Rhizobium/Agrobacterium group TaxID=227290 RepID=UPI0022B82D66|nr:MULTISPECIES: ABC transporter substrate-binding protein [Rhizobium/Agrobacterium group]MCZ7889965.1 ABC transporter substrate-binding protein [Agrobacterium salinitolerans]MDA5636466.1 ABC transporter substrate-binding protein [Agrobacterium sp. ST15.16.024]MDF1892318.1 ABC transporter substrate-binding protein [Rhizobium rhizogenes]
MKKHILFAAAAMLASASIPAWAGETIKVGLILSFSGQGAGQAQQVDNAIKLYLKEHEKDLGDTKIEIVRRDDTGPNGDVAKRLAQELITREKVDFLAGFVFTPNINSVAPLSTQAKVPTVVMNAATSSTVEKSPYIVRTSFTLAQEAYPFGQWVTKQGLKRVYTAVTDYAPGQDAEAAFTKGLTENGGTVAGTLRMPLKSPDFSPFMQRIKDAKPDALFLFVPSGREATAAMRAYADLGLADAGIKLFAAGDVLPEDELPNMGDVPPGVISIFHYSMSGDRPANKAFVSAWQKEYGDLPVYYSAVGGWDGMDAIVHAVKEQNGKLDPAKTMELLQNWRNDNSPRGPVMIDPQTRDVVQNMYIRRLERRDGKLANIEIETLPMVKDPLHTAK